MPRRGIDGVREPTGSAAGDRAQTLAHELARAARLLPFFHGKAKRVRLLSLTPKTVNHRLGRPAGWFIIHPNHDGGGATSEVSEMSSAFQSALDENNQISLIATENCTVTIWFYPRLNLEVE